MAKKEVLILGIGNILWADEGFGVRCVERINAEYSFGKEVSIIDGGTQGIYLLPYIEETNRLIVFDAVDYGKAPGTFIEALNDEVPRFMGAKKMSLHQTGFQEVIFASQLKDALPSELVLIGVQAQDLDDYGGSLRPLIKSKIPEAINRALFWFDKWQIKYQKREGGEIIRVNDLTLEIDAYEQERPPESEACRIGDSRVLMRK